MGELGAAVDPRRLIGVALDDHRVAPLGGGDVDDVGQIIFARRIVVADLAEPAEQVAGANAPSCPQLHRRTARSSSVASRYSTIFAMRSPCPRMIRPYFAGSAGREASTTTPGPSSPSSRSSIRAQRSRLDERRVAVEDEHRRRRSPSSAACGLLDRVAGALLLAPGRRSLTSRPASAALDLLAALADDHDALVGAERVDPVEQVQQQRPAGDRVQHLVRVGAHARPLPRGEDHDGKTACVGSSPRAMAWAPQSQASAAARASELRSARCRRSRAG